MSEVKKTTKAELTPMMKQYYDMKETVPDAIMFFRLGDFYEMFEDDAILAARELELTLTARSNMPMCGVPHHAYENYVNRLIDKGYKVAICEQIGDPKAKGLTKREITKILTPGTVLSESSLPGTQNNYIVLLAEIKNGLNLVGADVSTGEFFCGFYTGADFLAALCDELYRLQPRECLLYFAASSSKKEALLEFFRLRLPHCLKNTLTKLPEEISLAQGHFAALLPEQKEMQRAIEGLLAYLHETVKSDLSHLNRLTCLDTANCLQLDSYTLRNLEITHNLRDGGKKRTLFAVLDCTDTAMGSRRLGKWLEAPLLSLTAIERRQQAIENLVTDFALRDELKKCLKNIYDFERLLTRVEVGNTSARDMLALKSSLFALPLIKALLQKANAPLLTSIETKIELYASLCDLLEHAIAENPGFLLRDGNIIKDGFDEELDEYRHLAKDSRQLLQQIEQREREETGIKSLKISYNKVFGYYIEVRKTSLEQVPEHYIRKQTLANAERYITPELKEFETKILGAQEKIIQIEYNLFMQVRAAVQKYIPSIQHTAAQIANLDALCALAQCADQYNYIRPQLSPDGIISISEGRHPLVERMLKDELFVPNDAQLDNAKNEILIITGPNMAGKSTYMRQIALLTLMAQTGSFIPARKATISPVDRIFTRIGASDDLISGQSTFMMEMNEVAHILKYATAKSLIILDEIGRGTSTYDGMSIARAVIEYIRDKVKAKTLFATHYHELTDLEDDAHVKNYCVAVKEKGRQVTFLRRIIKGRADKSYGIHVARLAGLPECVTARAEKILDVIEKDTPAPKAASQPTEEEAIVSLFDESIKKRLLLTDVMTLTPLEALNLLYELQQKAKEGEGEL